ncbi:hypothetical protein [Streptomyces olivochromogenes]|uniref:hypothetical protein n=1 Tax=Streptomyces olivochromogenes TaxID=1963 RepID=UPI001F238A0F|nr:hypothetical protein [Streptomyces olivochromogenes]MCF3131532.1 hypothetical protein [Streptomyces olivochromogenes]
MTVTWRSAFLYALTVVVLSWLTGAAVDLAWQATSGGIDTWLSFWLKDPWNAVFVAATTVVLTLARRLDTPLPRRRVILVDGGLYLAAFLASWGVSVWAAGDGAPVDGAFFMAYFALFTLQLPAAWLLSAWRSGHLQVVLKDHEADSANRDRTSQ